MSKRRINVITLGILLSLFLASMEGTVVSTAMPSIVGQLGGLSIYSWVFSIYMLASTTSVPIYGKISDLFGRKPVYLFSMGLFLVGSVLCAMASSMEQLILFRAVQGLGAGGVLPLAFTIIGELFSLEQRTRMQGLFSGVWGVSAVIGPLVGGFLVDQVSWHWVFLVNLFPGLLSIACVWLAWNRAAMAGDAGAGRPKPSLDVAGVLLLTFGTLALLYGLGELQSPLGWGLLVTAVLLLGALVWVERRAAEPVLPLGLFSQRLFTITILHGLLAGWAMFGSLNYVPLFIQAVLGTSATQAGITLTPMSLSWTLASIVGTQLMLRFNYRSLALVGMVLLAAGALGMTFISSSTSQYLIMLYVSVMGVGMGLSIPAFLIAVQTSVPRSQLGAATSAVQFSRSIGGTLGTSVLGVVLSSQLAAGLLAAGLDPATVSLDTLLDPLAGAAAVNGPVREALSSAIAGLFLIAFVAAALGLVVVFFTPRGKLAHLEQQRAGEDVAGFPEG